MRQNEKANIISMGKQGQLVRENSGPCNGALNSRRSHHGGDGAGNQFSVSTRELLSASLATCVVRAFTARHRASTCFDHKSITAPNSAELLRKIVASDRFARVSRLLCLCVRAARPDSEASTYDPARLALLLVPPRGGHQLPNLLRNNVQGCQIADTQAQASICARCARMLPSMLDMVFSSRSTRGPGTSEQLPICQNIPRLQGSGS